MNYPVIIHKDTESDYGVTVPDLPGCFTAGESMDEALMMAKEAIETHLEGLTLDKEPIPPATTIEDLQRSGEYSDGTWALIEIDLSKLAVNVRRINITMPENVIAAADEYAKSHHISRSGLLTQAVTEYIGKK